MRSRSIEVPVQKKLGLHNLEPAAARFARPGCGPPKTGVRMTKLAGTLRYAAFTDAGTGGNPAGVVLEAAGIDDERRLAIAAEIGYSETAFVEPAGPNGEYRLRFFSPRAEVGFCGHATIATAVAIAERSGAGVLRFDTAVGEVVVRTTIDDAGVLATLTSVP